VYRKGKVIDITEGNLLTLIETPYPGGGLGPIRRLGRPDLTSLSLSIFSCQKDDLLFAVTDGVYGVLLAIFFLFFSLSGLTSI
jgi:hypothetical protein